MKGDNSYKRSESRARLENRILEIDVLRGIAVILMVFDHSMFDLWGFVPGLISDYPQSVINFSCDYWTWGVRIAVRYAVVFVFLALTGICCSFSRSNIKRGLKLMCVALGLTLATFIIGRITGDRNMTIIFGILHCISLALIIIGLLELIKTDKWIYLALGAAMFIFGIVIKKDAVHYSIGDIGTFELIVKTFAGYATCGGDSAGFFFNGGQIFIGVFLGKLLYSDRKSLFGASYKNNFLTRTGRHSLFVYIASQVIMPVLITLVFLCAGYHLAL